MSYENYAYIKNGDNIQLVHYLNGKFYKHSPTGSTIKIAYSYYPEALTKDDTVPNNILELVRLLILARFYEATGNIQMGITMRGYYREELVRYKKANAGKNAVGRMTTYNV